MKESNESNETLVKEVREFAPTPIVGSAFSLI